jgi:hypothetical protein
MLDDNSPLLSSLYHLFKNETLSPALLWVSPQRGDSRQAASLEDPLF